MNIEDYAQYMIQKHLLAIVLAVIKTKPANVTYETYIDDIRNKIKEKDMESNLDVTICEEDFDISDDFTHDGNDQMASDDQNMMKNDDQVDKSQDSVTILQNFELNDWDQPCRGNDDANSLLDVMTELDNIEENSVNEIFMNNSQNNCTQSTNFDESQIPVNISANKTNEIADDIKMFCETYIESNHKVDYNSNDVLNISDSQKHATSINKDVSNITYHINNNLTEENRHTFNLVDNNIDKGVTNKIIIENNDIDSQQTLLYTLQGFTSNTHVSQSQEDFVIANKNLLNRTKTALNNNVCNAIVTKNINNSQMYEQNVRKVIQNSKDALEDSYMYANIIKESDKAISMDTSHDSVHFDANKINILDKITIFIDNQEQKKNKNLQNNYNNESKRIKIDTNDNIYTKSSSTLSPEYTLRDNTKDITPKFSQYGQNIHIDRLNFESNAMESKRMEQSTEFRSSPVQSQSLLTSNENYGSKSINTSLEYIKTSVNDVYTESGRTYSNNYSNLTEKEINKNKIKLKENIDDPDLSKTVKYTSNYKRNRNNCQMDSKDFYNDTDDEMKVTSNLKESSRLKESVFNNLPNDETEKDISHKKKRTNECISNDNTQMGVPSENEADTQVEIVSFKTLEELNRIKSYLNKRERRFSEVNNSLDSGFKSSQPRSSYNSASQYSEVWINESAHSLLSFITVSQLTDSTTEIAEEISRVLGKLVDKLHEEEKYPNFLEELLEKVHVLLNDIYEGNNGEFNALLKRDDTIYRISLLNRSKHVIHYTIEKIIIILEKTNSDLTEDVFELKDIEKAENLCYIFHILEVMLKRVKKSNESSQMSVQNSQDDDRILKRSSLTEIWRKKWNLTKTEIIEGSAKKKCVLTKCSEVLNKMIVQSIDGYSLVSFAALQCFNLLQN